MTKAFITDNLYLRNDRPSRSGTTDSYFQKGDTVMIKKAVFGESIEGNNIWYELEDGKYIWSGCVKPEKPVPLPKKNKRVIFTSDDYGAVPSINTGVMHAIRYGVLNSVACFTNAGKNGEKSLAYIRQLQKVVSQVNRPVELGVHLTLTSGSPVLGINSVPLLCRDGKERKKAEKEFRKKFEKYEKAEKRRAKVSPSESEKNRAKGDPETIECGFHSVRKIVKRYKKTTNKSEFINQLKAEMRAQMDVFINAKDLNGNPDPIPIDHLTSHHNTMFFYPEFFKVLIDLAYVDWIPDNVRRILVDKHKMQIPIPIRSLNNVPPVKEYLYMRFRAWHDGDNGWLKGPLEYLGRLNCAFCDPDTRAGKIKTPGFLNSDHYGPLPIQQKYGESFLLKIDQKKEKAGKMLDQLRHGDYNSMEFLLHIRKGRVYPDPDLYFGREVWETGYDGVDARAFDSRMAEFTSFTSKYKKESDLPEGVELGTWKELELGESCQKCSDKK